MDNWSCKSGKHIIGHANSLFAVMRLPVARHYGLPGEMHALISFLGRERLMKMLATSIRATRNHELRR